MYNTYEEYMRQMLGYNTYNPNENTSYYEPVRFSVNMQEVNKLYPEIYRIIYPLIQKLCSNRRTSGLTEEDLNQMVDEIYKVVETENSTSEQEKNGDVRNPRAKEPQKQETNNYLLKDLIRILIIRECMQKNNNMMAPNMGSMPPIMRARL